jgi:maleate cis-trans isomerase
VIIVIIPREYHGLSTKTLEYLELHSFIMAENPTIVVSENPNICQQPVAVAQEIVFDLENRKVGIAAAQCVQLRDLKILVWVKPGSINPRAILLGNKQFVFI